MLARWGRALDSLTVQILIAHELGDYFYGKAKRSRNYNNIIVRGILTRLHARGCQVAHEIMALLEGGYADGAVVRWRTLHEITVIAPLIADNGFDLAERYRRYDAVEAKKELDRYKEHLSSGGTEKISKSTIRKIDKEYYEVLSLYGSNFRHDYGWCAEFIGKNRPTFQDLESAADQAHMRLQYKTASYNLHGFN